MTTCTIAVDRAIPENGCLQLVKGSHRLGRMEHLRIGAASGADPARLELVLARPGTAACAMAPGDALLFHLHTLNSAHRRVGKEYVPKCRTCWSPYHYKKK